MEKFKRVFVVVMDSLGVGAMPDSADFGDIGVNTLGHISESVETFQIPNLQKLGMANIIPLKQVAPVEKPLGYYGKLREKSRGKDTMTGHWEMMGLEVTKPFQTFTETGFPPELIKELPEETVCLTWGYAAEQREHEAKVMAEAGARQYLCPGVGGWNQWMNLVENSYKNIARMCGYARKYHAEGVLNTDWGDCGHINQPDFSLPGMIYGAVFSWGDDTDSFEELNEQISRLAYGDRSGKFVSYMAKTAECSIFDWWDANVVYEEKVLGHPNNRNALFDARIQDEAKRAAAKETIAALKKELKKTAGALEESCRPMVPVLELTMEAIDIWNETGARMCDIELGKEKDETACAALAGRLETWFMKYKASWRSISKEGDLHHISEIVFWYADILRGRKPYEK